MHHTSLWRRFRPHRKTSHLATQGPLVERLHKNLDEVLGQSRGKLRPADVVSIAATYSRDISDASDAAAWFTLLVLRTPGAVRAQNSMDDHPHELHRKQARLFELIDFNDAFVSTVLALTPEQRKTFSETAKQEMDLFCHRVGTTVFTDEQYEAITKGLSKEVAVYLGAKKLGYRVTMTSRSQDAMGVDMVIADASTGRSLNIDCKTSSAYHYRLKDLVEQGRMSQEEAEQADVDGFAHEVNGHDAESVAVTLLRIDPNEVGDIEGFELKEPMLLQARLRKLFD